MPAPTRILLHSNAPHVATGYGVQAALLSERLKADGHDVAISCNYGLAGASLTRHGIKLYPCGYESNGNDVIHNHALHHFEGDPTGGWIVPLIDVWALKNPLLADFNVAAWTPVDHFPVPKDVLAFFDRTGAVPIAMSRYGHKQLVEAGLDPLYVPLAVDTKVYQPSPTLDIGGREVTGRELIGVPEDAYVVGMVGMNKGWARDRKGFNEAFRAFGQFWRQHPDAVLYVHADWPGGAEGINLKELAIHCGIPDHAIVFPDLYAYKFGFTAEMMAAVYTAFDVLLAPSHGEGFCVPLIEAQACGTPVIATDFSAQPELVGAGWLVTGQPEWDAAQSASYVCPSIGDVWTKLEEAWTALQDKVSRGYLAAKGRLFAEQYDADVVFDTYWRPVLEQLNRPAEVLELDRTQPFEVDVIVPLMRPDNLPTLVESFDATNDGTARLVFVCDNPTVGEALSLLPKRNVIQTGKDRTSYAEKVNLGFGQTDAPWIFIPGDDVCFHDGWLQAAAKLANRFDVIGTNDAADGNGNPTVQSGSHSDHFFVRRAYVDEYGASLEGPGIVCAEVYTHYFVDKELVGLAKARGAFSPCLDSVVEHLHPDFGKAKWDDVYVPFATDERAKADKATFLSRLPLIEQQRTSRGKAA